MTASSRRALNYEWIIGSCTWRVTVWWGRQWRCPQPAGDDQVAKICRGGRALRELDALSVCGGTIPRLGSKSLEENQHRQRESKRLEKSGSRLAKQEQSKAKSEQNLSSENQTQRVREGSAECGAPALFVTSFERQHPGNTLRCFSIVLYGGFSEHWFFS